MTEHIVYEDERTEAVLVMEPKVAGQLVIRPKGDFPDIESIQPEMITHYFYVASFAASVLFEGLGAEATNIIMNEGAGTPFSITVIPRKKDDGIEFKWEPLKIPEEEMKDAQQKVSWEFMPPEESAPENTHVVSQEDMDQKTEEDNKKEEDQLVKWYEKIP